MPAYNEAVRLRNRFAGLPFDLPLMTEADLRERKRLIDQGRPLPIFGPKEAFMTVQERTIFYKQGRGDAGGGGGMLSASALLSPADASRAPRSGGNSPGGMLQHQQGATRRGELVQQLREDPEATSALRGLGVFTPTAAPAAAMAAAAAAAVTSHQQLPGRSSRKRQRDLLHAATATDGDIGGMGAPGRATPKGRKQQHHDRKVSPVRAPQWIGDETGATSFRAASTGSSSSSFGDGIAEALLHFPAAAAAAAAAGGGARRNSSLLDSLAGPPETPTPRDIQDESEFGLLQPQQQQQQQQQQQHEDDVLRSSSAAVEGGAQGETSLPLGGTSPGAPPAAVSDWEPTAMAANIAASMGLPLEEFAERLSLFIRRAEGHAAAAAAVGAVGNELAGGDTTHHASPALEAALSAVEARGAPPYVAR